MFKAKYTELFQMKVDSSFINVYDIIALYTSLMEY